MEFTAGGIGIRSAVLLAPSAFLASAVSALLCPCMAILPVDLHTGQPLLGRGYPSVEVTVVLKTPRPSLPVCQRSEELGHTSYKKVCRNMRTAKGDCLTIRAALNSIIHKAPVSANIISSPEPRGFCRSNCERPDGLTITPWSRGYVLLHGTSPVGTLLPHPTLCYLPLKLKWGNLQTLQHSPGSLESIKPFG